MARRDTPVDWSVLEPRHSRRPATPMEALMSADADEDPVTSQLELLELREVLVDAMDQLTERERDIVEATVIERAPLRELARRWGMARTTIAYRRDRALDKLALSLQDQPMVKQHLEGAQ